MTGGCFTGKVAVITGAAGAIGREIAARFAAEGARAVAADVATPPELPAGMPFCKTDVADEDDVRALMRFAENECGGLDVLVNCAGIGLEKDLCETSAAEWERVFAVNARGVFLCIKHAAGVMRARGGGAVVNIGSVEADGANPLHSAYAASKGAVHSITRNAALELGPFGVRCNAVAPGWIDTPFNERLLAQYPNPRRARAAIRGLHPVGRTGTPRDVADAVLWLAGDESAFVSGQIFTIDGGRTARLPLPALGES
ncbi:MAG: SDR family NAD(P)-dependent oxidoreductase [Gammaproteobacteria bacterium]